MLNKIAAAHGFIVSPTPPPTDKVMLIGAPDLLNIVQITQLAYKLVQLGVELVVKEPLPANSPLLYDDFVVNEIYEDVSSIIEPLKDAKTYNEIRITKTKYPDATIGNDENNDIGSPELSGITLRPMELITEDVLCERVFKPLLSSKLTLAPSQKKEIDWMLQYSPTLREHIPSEIPNKEVLILLAKHQVDVPIKTSTDVLRLAYALSGLPTDLRLPVKYKYGKRSSGLNPDYVAFKLKSYKRKERRFLLNLLDRVGNASEMVLRREQWIRLAERLHPGDYSTQYPHAYKVINKLRNTKVRSWYSLVKRTEDNLTDHLHILSQRPGELLRRVDKLLREYQDSNDAIQMILDEVVTAAKHSSPKVILELMRHMSTRDEPVEDRHVVIKNKHVPIKDLPAIKVEIITELLTALNDVLRQYYKETNDNLPADSPVKITGDCYISKDLLQIPIPKNLRDSGEEQVNYNIPVPIEITEGQFLSPYLVWNNNSDYDLSVMLVNVHKGVPTSERVSYSRIEHVTSAGVILHQGDIIPGRTDQPPFMESALIPAKVILEDVFDYIFVTTNIYSPPGDENKNVVGVSVLGTANTNPSINNALIQKHFGLEVAGVVSYVIDSKAMKIYPVDSSFFGSNNSSVINTGMITQIVKHLESLGDNPMNLYNLLSLRVAAAGYAVVDEPLDITEDEDGNLVTPLNLDVTYLNTNKDLILSWIL